MPQRQLSVHTDFQGYALAAVAHRRCPSCGGTVVLLQDDSSARRILTTAGVLSLCCEACQRHHYAITWLPLSFTGRQLGSLVLLISWVSIMAWWLMG